MGATSKWLFFPGLRSWSPEIVPKLSWLESRNCLEIVLVKVPELWELISPNCQVWSRRGLNQSYSSLQELSNAMLHSWFGCREDVDSWLLVVVTFGPSFAHNLGCRCPNDQFEGILDIYTSISFQWHQKHSNPRCFGFCCRNLNIRESQRTPSPQLWECEFHPHTWPKWGCNRFVPLVGPKWTPSNAKIGTKKNRAKMILLYQKKALKHVPLCTKGGLLANCLATHFNVQKKG